MAHVCRCFSRNALSFLSSASSRRSLISSVCSAGVRRAPPWLSVASIRRRSSLTHLLRVPSSMESSDVTVFMLRSVSMALCAISTLNSSVNFLFLLPYEWSCRARAPCQSFSRRVSLPPRTNTDVQKDCLTHRTHTGDNNPRNDCTETPE